MPTEDTEAQIAGLLDEMTLDEKASLTAGADLWHLPPVDRVGVLALKVSDGPSGVRGESMAGVRSLAFPCGMAVGSTWDPELVGDLGAALAGEAKSKGVHVLLGPTVCITRMPLAGRTFESFSEDPYLTTRLAVSYVDGVQGQGIGCCIKHFACNDQEHRRMTISARVDERTLREVHLPAFEAAVREAGVWAVMAAYNKVNGTYCGEDPALLGAILKGEWGFEGLVMSDWFGTHSTVAAAEAGLDIEMPGPPAWLGRKLAEAVRTGEVDEAVVDGQVRRILTLMGKAGLLAGPAGNRIAPGPEREEDDPHRRRVARRVATAGMVLLHNDGLLPLDPAPVRSVAVIGPNGDLLEMGGGSSEVTPLVQRSLTDALAERFPAATVTYQRGCDISLDLPTLDSRLVRQPGGGQGLLVEYLASREPAGDPVATAVGHRNRLLWLGGPVEGLELGQFSIRISGTFTPDETGEWTLGLESAGASRLLLDGSVVVDNSEPVPGKTFFGGGSEMVEAATELEAARAYDLVVELVSRKDGFPVSGVRIAGRRPQRPDDFERAVASAAAADVAVVVVGLNGEWESEGFDRPDLSLPGRQRELVEAVITANPRTVVVINAGSPVELPWVRRAGAVLMAWYAGEEGADALADVLAGAEEPGGRLPITFPTRIEDNSAFDHYPGSDGEVRYGEGVFVGYRNDERSGAEPAFAFGHGLSYTSFDHGDPTVDRRGLTLAVTNTGDRAGCEVLQLYVRPPQGGVERPDRELKGFAKVRLEARETRAVVLALGQRAFAHWNEATHGWVTEPGRYELLVGTSSADIVARAAVDIS